MRGRDSRRWASAGATLLAALACAVALGAGPAGAQYPGEAPLPNPCLGADAPELRCPDLQMAKPSELFVSRGHGRVLLHATNKLKSLGRGPVEVRGHRIARRQMAVKQVIHTRDGGRRRYATNGLLVFYPIPGQGRYWKFHEAARFELWTIGAGGTRERMVRQGPKLNYCLRDLEHVHRSARSPHHRVYPGCSQNPRQRARTLGTSVGWADVYPSSYHENWIDVKGLRGCFAFVHRADPDGYLFESNEHNNANSRKVLLPPRHCRVRSC